MSSDRSDEVIQPQTAPLSHLAKQRRSVALGVDGRSLAVIAGVVLVAGVIYWWAPSVVTVDVERPPAADTSTKAAKPQKASDLAPFAATQAQRVREKAQQALASFVESQIELEENLDVASWGQQELRDALALAQEGDKQFLAEKYDDALAAYDAANEAIVAIIAMADEVFAQHLADAGAAVDALDPQNAQIALEAALAIKPQDAGALSLKDRLTTLPPGDRTLAHCQEPRTLGTFRRRHAGLRRNPQHRPGHPGTGRTHRGGGRGA